MVLYSRFASRSDVTLMQPDAARERTELLYSIQDLGLK